MSFQRDLTGSSNLYANVILNTNVCASSVSTINLSATNASFTNITTNTWTAGNVSTPNVIATNAYFSNTYTSNFNASLLGVSNLSASNISTNYVSVLTRISAPVIEGVHVLRNTNSSMYLYSSGGFIVRGWNQSDPASFNLYYASTAIEDMFGMNLEVAKEQGTTRGYSRITVGQNLSFQVVADTELQLENTSISGWRFYNSLNSSYPVSFNRVSVSNISATSLSVTSITASTFGITNLSVSGVSAFGVSVQTVCASYAYISYVVALAEVINCSRDEYGDLYVMSRYGNSSYMSQRSMKTDGFNSSFFTWEFEESGIPKFVISTSGINASNILSSGNLCVSSISVSHMSSKVITCNSLNTCAGILFKDQYLIPIYANIRVFPTGVSNTCQWEFWGYKTPTIMFGAVNSSDLEVEIMTLSAQNISAVSCSINVSAVSSSFVSATRVSVSNLSIKLASVSNLSVSTLAVSVISGLVSASTMSMSNLSVSSVSMTTLTGSTISVSTLNVSTIGGTPSLTNLSVSTSATFGGNTCINTLYVSTIAFLRGTSSVIYGGVQQSNDDCFIYSNNVNAVPSKLRFGNNGNIRFDISQSGVSSYMPFYASTGNFSTLNVNTFSPTNITTTTVTATNVSTTNLSVITINNISNISTSKVITTRCDGFIVRDCNTSGTAYFALNYDNNTIGDTYGLILTVDQTDGAVIEAGVECPLTIMLDGVSQLYNTCAGGFQFYNTINSSFATNLSNVSASNLSIVNITTSTISTSYVSSTRVSVTNISITNASVATNITGTACSFTTIRGTNVFPSGNVCAPNIRATIDITTNGFGCSTIACSLWVSSASVSTIDMSVSNASITTGTATSFRSTTLNATTGNFSTLNVSTFAPTTISVTNLCVNTSATLSNVCINTLYVSTIGFLAGTSSILYGGVQQSPDACFIYSQNINAVPSKLRLGNNGNIRFDISQSGVSSYMPFYASTGNFSTLNVNTFAPANINTTTINGSTVNASSSNICNLSVSTIIGSTISVSASTINSGATLNVSVLNCSSTNIVTGLPTSGSMSYLNACNANICSVSTSYLSCYDGTFNLLTAGALYPGMLILKTQYDAPSLSWSTSAFGAGGRMGADFSTSTFDLTVYPYNICYFNIIGPNTYLNVSSLNVCDENGSLIMNVNTCINTCRLSISNISTTTITATTVSATNLSISKINNSFNISNTTQPLTIFSVSNTFDTGLRVPTYLDSQDLGALTIGYNQSAGFINVCRATRFYSNILTDSNINGINATDSITFGNNITTGNLRIGNATMTGNISIQTMGDCIFECDRRSTWNTSDLLPQSTQLGSHYSTTTTNSFTKTNTGQTFVFTPTNNNVSLTTFPIGLYQVFLSGYIRTQSNVSGNFNGVITSYNAGICYGTGYNLTSGNTTRFALMTVGTPNYMTNTSGVAVPFSVTGLINMSTTGKYIGAFCSATMGTAATAGSLYMEVQYTACVKIA